MVTIIIIVACIAVGYGVVYLLRKKRAERGERCPYCKKDFIANEIVEENLIGDGLKNGRWRKLSVTMKCSRCGRMSMLKIMSEYRRSAQGSAAYQHFKAIEEKRRYKNI